MTRGIVYYSDCRLDPTIALAAQRTIERAGLPIVAVTLAPIDWPAARNIGWDGERGYLTMFRQILAGLEASDADRVFFCEHDVLYPKEHFDLNPADGHLVYYNQNVWKVDAKTGHALHYRCSQTSGLYADRQLLIAHYRERVRRVELEGFSRAMGFEPGTHTRPERVDDLQDGCLFSYVPLVDIRHAQNLTPSRWKKSQFRNQKFTEGWTEGTAVPGWGETFGRMPAFLDDVISGEAVHA